MSEIHFFLTKKSKLHNESTQKKNRVLCARGVWFFFEK